jgi:hypothetical protein
MSTELPNKPPGSMAEPNIDKNVHSNIEKDNAERAGGSSNNDTNTLSKSEQSKVNNLQKYIDIIGRAEQNPDLSNEEKEPLRNQIQKHVNEKNKIENRGKYTAEDKPDKSSANPSEDYDQNIQSSSTTNNPKEAASDPQIKLDQLKGKLRGDFGQSGKQPDSKPTDSESADDIKS